MYTLIGLALHVREGSPIRLRCEDDLLSCGLSRRAEAAIATRRAATRDHSDRHSSDEREDDVLHGRLLSYLNNRHMH